MERRDGTMMINEPADAINKRPIVSVIMANYDGASYLGQSIGSVCRQTLRNIEIVVSDDGSTDGSIGIVKRLMAEDPRIRLVTADSNTGPAGARNRAIDVAKGLWLAIMDSDDLMHPARLETLVEAANHDGADIVADDLLIFDSTHVRSPRALLTGKWTRAPRWVDTLTFLRVSHLFGRGPTLGYLKPLIRSSLLASVQGPYDETLRIDEDYNLILRLLLRGAKYRVYPTLHYFYRKHAKSISHRLNEEALIRIQAAELRLLRDNPNIGGTLGRSIKSRTASIDAALAFERVLKGLKSGAYASALATIFRNPRTCYLLRFPIGARMSRILKSGKSRDLQSKTTKRQVCVISNQRIIGRTNGSSTYLLDIVTDLAAHNMEVHFVAPSPATLGRWPYLILSKEVASVFKTFRVRGTWRVANCLISKDPRRMIQGAFAILESFLLKRGLLLKPVLRPAPYSIAVPLTRDDRLFLARYVPVHGDYLIADYCFLTEAFPYALRPDARSAVLMHDYFSARPKQFEGVEIPDSVAALTDDEECTRLAKADCIVAIQQEEAELVRSRLPNHCVVVVPMAASPVRAPQSGDSNLILFVGSKAAANVDGVRWFLASCWPQILRDRPDTRFWVAGTVTESIGPAPEGVRFLGLVNDLGPLYRQAGVVVSPLRVGSGLKIKLIEALKQGKAVVASPITLQGVTDILSNAVRIADGPAEFVSAVIALLDDKMLRADLASRGLDALSHHFSPERCYGPLISEINNSNLPPSPEAGHRRQRRMAEPLACEY